MSRSQHDLEAKLWLAYNFVIRSQILKLISQKWSLYWDDVSCARFRSLPWRSRSQHDLAAKLCPPHNLVFWSLILKLLDRNYQHKEATCHEQHLGRYIEGQGHSMTLQQNRVWSITLLLEVKFTIISQKWSPYWDDMSRTTFGSLSWSSRSQHDLVAKMCLAHNFVILSRILQLFNRNDHYIEMTCRVQHFGRYLEGQGHSMTLH